MLACIVKASLRMVRGADLFVVFVLGKFLGSVSINVVDGIDGM